jgi:hypothetical protein
MVRSQSARCHLLIDLSVTSSASRPSHLHCTEDNDNDTDNDDNHPHRYVPICPLHMGPGVRPRKHAQCLSPMPMYIFHHSFDSPPTRMHVLYKHIVIPRRRSCLASPGGSGAPCPLQLVLHPCAPTEFPRNLTFAFGHWTVPNGSLGGIVVHPDRPSAKRLTQGSRNVSRRQPWLVRCNVRGHPWTRIPSDPGPNKTISHPSHPVERPAGPLNDDPELRCPSAVLPCLGRHFIIVTSCTE